MLAMCEQHQKKRIAIILIALCVACLCLGAYLINKPPYLPVKQSFDSKTGMVTFKLDPKYHFQRISLNYGYYPQPDFDDQTSEVSFCVFELPMHRHEFILFICQKGEGDKVEEVALEFEVLRQNPGEILITAFYGGLQFSTYRQTYIYNY